MYMHMCVAESSLPKTLFHLLKPQHLNLIVETGHPSSAVRDVRTTATCTRSWLSVRCCLSSFLVNLREQRLTLWTHYDLIEPT